MSEGRGEIDFSETLCEEIRRFFGEQGFHLCGEPSASLWELPDSLLLYVLSLLWDHPQTAPPLSDEQWEKLFHLLLPHKILPFLFWKLSRVEAGQKPPEKFLSRLRELMVETKVRSLLLERQLSEVVSAFAAADLPVLVMKGPSLAWSLYPEPATRPSSDIDLLIRPQDFPAVRALLEKQGYYTLKRKYEAERQFHNEESMIPRNQKHSYRLDLHWALHSYSFTDHEQVMQGIFARAQKINSRPFSFSILSPEDAICQAALHLIWSHYQNMSLIWICDVSLLARSLASPAAWQTLQQRSEEMGAIWSVQTALRLAQLWTGLQLPPEFADFEKWPAPHSAELSAWERLQENQLNLRTIFSLYWSPEWSLRKKFFFLFRLVFPPPELIQQSYPVSSRWLLPFSYLQRWWRWAKAAFKKKRSE